MRKENLEFNEDWGEIEKNLVTMQDEQEEIKSELKKLGFFFNLFWFVDLMFFFFFHLRGGLETSKR